MDGFEKVRCVWGGGRGGGGVKRGSEEEEIHRESGVGGGVVKTHTYKHTQGEE